MNGSVFTIELSGRKALVTGGSRGIGLSAAKFLARAGCQVKRSTLMLGRSIRITLNEFASPRARVEEAVPA